MRDLDDGLELQDVPARVAAREVEDARRLLADGLFELPGVGLAVRADLDEPRPRLADVDVVVVSLEAVDHDLVLETVGEGEPVHEGRVSARDAGGRAQHEAGGGAARDVGRLVSRHPGDSRARLRVEFVHVHLGGVRLPHGGPHLGPHFRAAEDGLAGARADDAADSDVFEEFRVLRGFVDRLAP